jgi:hypothetical protein
MAGKNRAGGGEKDLGTMGKAFANLGEVMKKRPWTALGIALGATLFMFFQSSFFAAHSEGGRVALSQRDSARAPSEKKPADTAPLLQIKIDNTSLENHGEINLSGTVPAGKPVYLEVWSDEKVRASRFDSDPDEETGERPYILYMTEQMPAYYKIQIPLDKLNLLLECKRQGKNWSCSKALEDFGAEDAFSIPAGIAIDRYQATLTGSVVGSRGSLLPVMDSKENRQQAMRLVKARFRTLEVLFVSGIEIKPDGSFSAKIVLPEGAPKGKYNVRAVVDRNIASNVVSFENKITFPYVYLSNAGTSINLFYPFFLSLAISIFGVLMGAGGGFILNPLLVSLWPLPHTVVAGTVMPTILFSQGSGIVNYSRIKFINWKLGVSIGLAMVLGGFIGPKLTELVTVDQYKFVFGWILIALAGLMLWQTTPAYLAKNSKEQAILKEYRKKAEKTASARSSRAA